MTKLLELLSSHTGMAPSSIVRIVQTAPLRYKHYEIPKKNGGVRKVSQPSKELKILQRALIDVVLNKLPIHGAATAYRVGKSILDNAKAHAGVGPVLKMDFKDFFPSIRRSDWISYCHKTGCLTSEEDIELSSQLLFKKQKGMKDLRLAIGAPSSPILSNILMFEFDSHLVSNLEQDVIYTRYADDLTFSAPKNGYLVNVVSAVRSTIRHISLPRLVINAEKTAFVTRKYQRRVTGLTLTNDAKISIGHKKKRELHAQVHKFSIHGGSEKEVQQLGGYLAFVHSAEPAFLGTLAKKYGADVIRKIFSANNSSENKH